jgi:hypothetical protein
VKRNNVPKVVIKNPCKVKWETLPSRGCERFCSYCQHEVFDLTTKSNEEIVALVMNKSGKLCGKLANRQVRKVIFQDQPKKGFIRAVCVFLFGFASVTQASDSNTSKEKEGIEQQVYFSFDDFVQVEGHLVNYQDSTVRYSGIVLDSGTNQPLADVAVVIKGTEFVTTTDKNGAFDLTIVQNRLLSAKPTLMFSYIGYANQEVELTPETKVNITIELRPEEMWIGEVFVPWYQRFWWTIKYSFIKNKTI